MSLHATRQVTAFWEELTRNNETKTNFGLQTNKLLRFKESGNKPDFSYLNKDDKEATTLFHPFRPDNHCPSINAYRHRERRDSAGEVGLFHFAHKQHIEAYGQSGAIDIIPVENLEVNWRLAIGLGVASVFETGMTFHPVYGIPYLPGSIIKGTVRHYAIDKICEFLDVTEHKEQAAIQDHGFCTLFGCGEEGVTDARQGAVTFFDALPKQNLKVEPDIMNPHFSPYYMGEDVPPADWHMPVPIFFLTVKNAKFDFFLGVQPRQNNALKKKKSTWRDSLWEGQSIASVVSKLLFEALAEHGIGAKTAVDYGRLKGNYTAIVPTAKAPVIEESSVDDAVIPAGSQIEVRLDQSTNKLKRYKRFRLVFSDPDGNEYKFLEKRLHAIEDAPQDLKDGDSVVLELLTPFKDEFTGFEVKFLRKIESPDDKE